MTLYIGKTRENILLLLQYKRSEKNLCFIWASTPRDLRGLLLLQEMSNQPFLATLQKPLRSLITVRNCSLHAHDSSWSYSRSFLCLPSG